MTQVCNGSFEIVRRCSVKSDLLNVSRTPNSLAHDPQVGEALSSHPRVWRIDREAPQSSGFARRLWVSKASHRGRYSQPANLSARAAMNTATTPKAMRPTLRPGCVQCVLPSPSAGRACRVPERRVRCEERTRQLSANGASLGRRYCPDRSASSRRPIRDKARASPDEIVTVIWRFRVSGRRPHNTVPRLLERAGITPGQRVLDLCSGPGWLAIEAARAVAPDGHGGEVGAGEGIRTLDPLPGVPLLVSWTLR